jgi:autophagy-related protein 16
MSAFDWRQDIFAQLTKRNQLQTKGFQDLISENNKLLLKERHAREDSVKYQRDNNELKRRNEDLIKQVEKYQQEQQMGISPEQEQQLNQRIFKLQEELAQAYKQISESSKSLLDLTGQLKTSREDYEDKLRVIDDLRAQISDLEHNLQSAREELKDRDVTISILKEELQALQVELVRAEERVKQVDKENKELLDRWMKRAAEDAKKMDEASQLYQTIADLNKKNQLLEAVKGNQPSGPLTESLLDRGSGMIHVTIPKQVKKTISAHEGECNSVSYNGSGMLLVTAGQDKLVKLWDVPTGSSKSQLSGAVQSVNSACFDWNTPNDNVLAASNDNAARVWTIQGGLNRLRHSLTGHISKVSHALFTFDNQRVVTASHDRTLKVWDLSKGYCIRTLFCFSSANGVALSYDNSMIASAHLDSHLRIWDMKNGEPIRDMDNLHSQQITSVTLAPDGRTYLTNSRDNTLKLIDNRTWEEVVTLKHDSYRSGVNFARACFSPDGQYVAAGSIDGLVFIWETTTGKLESILKKGHKTTVVATAWHPNGHQIASCDRNGAVVLWE